MEFTPWVRHFERNQQRQRALQAQIDGAERCRLDTRRRRAFIRSFQRFELGESGDGRHLLAKAERAGDAQYTRALALLVAEEQRHSALFARGLDHLGGKPLARHWSSTAFIALRRALGLRTELGLFLVAEAVAIEYFTALATGAPDPVLRAIGRRLEHDERDHLRFQIDRLAQGWAGRPLVARSAVRVALLAVGLGATVVLVTDHRAALRACGRNPVGYAWRALRRLQHLLGLALGPNPPVSAAPCSSTAQHSRPGGRSAVAVDPGRGEEHRGAAFLAHDPVEGVPVVVGAAGPGEHRAQQQP
jgi:hypothetical protein